MAFEVSVSPYAREDINNAIDYYLNHVKSSTVAENFYRDVMDAFEAIALNPYYRFYDSFRGKPLHDFPYIVFFDVHENTNTVEILGVFNTNQDPKKYPSP